NTDTKQSFDLRRIDLAPGPVALQFLDLGNGKVRVTVEPSTKFFEGTTFRLGGSSPIEVASTTDRLLLDLAALDIVRQGVLVGVRGEKERPLVDACVDPGKAAAVPQNCETIPSVQSSVGRSTNNCNDPFSGFKILQVDPTPVSPSISRVKVTLDKLRPQFPNDLPFLTLLGDKVFGLQDSPYETYTPCNPSANPPCTTGGIIEFLADNATLEKTGSLEVVRLFWDTAYHTSYQLNRAGKLVVAKQTIVSEDGGLRLMLEGQGLDRAVITFPANLMFDAQAPGYAILFIPTDKMTKLKHVVLRMTGAGGALVGMPVLVDVSKSTTPPPAPVLNSLDPVKFGTSVDVPITWKNEGTIKSVTYRKRSQPVTPVTKNSATIRLEDALTIRPGKVDLVVLFEDKTELPLTVQVVDQHVA